MQICEGLSKACWRVLVNKKTKEHSRQVSDKVLGKFKPGLGFKTNSEL